MVKLSTRSIVMFNTLTRSMEKLQTVAPDRATMYVCGPTVYNYAHIGNARPAIVFDTLARLLRRCYREVIYARNLTDVDDKINEAAQVSGASIDNITAKFIQAYQEDMQSLSVLPPDIEPRVTQHIPEIVALINKLIARGNAYVANEHVLFSVGSYAGYGAFSGRKLEDMLAGARVEVAPYKRDPMDFVLWKPSSTTQPGWNSPWGIGRPGWHVECSAMIERHLGTTIDIHGGGQDLIFPHHENEIAQGTCAHDGALYCHTWIHNSFVTVDGRKMSKSLGNVLLVRDLVAEAPGEAIRLAILSTHYRRPLDWNERRLANAKQTLTKFYRCLASAKNVEIDPLAEPDAQVLDALCDDLNVPVAIARLHQLSDLVSTSSPTDVSVHKSIFLASAGLLGLLQKEPVVALQELKGTSPTTDLTSRWDNKLIERRIAERNAARTAKNFLLADALRKELEQGGIELADSASGTVWRRIEEVA